MSPVRGGRVRWRGVMEGNRMTSASWPRGDGWCCRACSDVALRGTLCRRGRRDVMARSRQERLARLTEGEHLDRDDARDAGRTGC